MLSGLPVMDAFERYGGRSLAESASGRLGVGEVRSSGRDPTGRRWVLVCFGGFWGVFGTSLLGGVLLEWCLRSFCWRLAGGLRPRCSVLWFLACVQSFLQAFALTARSFMMDESPKCLEPLG